MFYFNIYKDFIDIRLQVITVASPTNILQYTRGHSWVRFAICRSFLFAALVGKLKATRSDAYPRPRPPGTPTDRPHPVPGVPRAVTAVAASPLPPPPPAPVPRETGARDRTCGVASVAPSESEPIRVGRREPTAPQAPHPVRAPAGAQTQPIRASSLLDRRGAPSAGGPVSLGGRGPRDGLGRAATPGYISTLPDRAQSLGAY